MSNRYVVTPTIKVKSQPQTCKSNIDYPSTKDHLKSMLLNITASHKSPVNQVSPQTVAMKFFKKQNSAKCFKTKYPSPQPSSQRNLSNLINTMKRFVKLYRHKQSEELSQINALLSRTSPHDQLNKMVENNQNLNPSRTKQNLIDIFRGRNRNSKPQLSSYKVKRPPSLKPRDLSRTLSTYSSCPQLPVLPYLCPNASTTSTMLLFKNDQLNLIRKRVSAVLEASIKRQKSLQNECEQLKQELRYWKALYNTSI